MLCCDRADKLVRTMELLRGNVQADLITANRPEDLLSIISSVQPKLCILSFGGNQSVLNQLNAAIPSFTTPVLCLSGDPRNSMLRCLDHNVIFNESEELINDPGGFQLKVRSILMLATQPYPVREAIPSGSLTSSRQSGDLSRYVMEIEQRNQTLSRIKKRIGELSQHVDDSTRSELMSIVNSIRVSTSDDRHWKDFKIYFQNINPRFLEVLSRKHPCLTPKDLKYCCYLKMNMSNEDIRRLLSINSESVRTHKYRLKKKMDLSKEQDLRQYLNSVTEPVDSSFGLF